MSSQSSTVRHVLQGLNWRRTPDFPLSLPDLPGFIVLREDEPAEPEQRQHWIRFPGEVRIASFDDIGAAEKERWQHERAIRQHINPFRCGGDKTWHWTQLDETGLRNWMRTGGIPSPEEGEAWADWYDRCQGGWDDKRREAIWEPLTKVRFFEVVQRPCTAPVFAVVKVKVGNTGGVLLGVYRSRDRAEAERQQQLERLAQKWGLEKEDFPALCLSANNDPFGGDLSENHEFLKASEWDFDWWELPFYRIVELDWGHDGEVGDAVTVVQQVELCLYEPIDGNKARQLESVHDEEGNQALIPVLVFADSKAADRFIATKEAEARRLFPPFLLYGPPPPEQAREFDKVLTELDYLPGPRLLFQWGDKQAEVWERDFEEWWSDCGWAWRPSANEVLWRRLCSQDPYFYRIQEVTLEG